MQRVSGMKIKKFLAYQGEEYTIEWYYNEQGNSNARKYFDTLAEVQKDRLFYLLQRMGDTGSIANKEKFNYEGDQIFAFKPAPDRFLCFFFEGSKIIITNAFKKQTQKMPPKEKERALSAKNDYILRYKKGTYYE